jgi:hypothetical protein
LTSLSAEATSTTDEYRMKDNSASAAILTQNDAPRAADTPPLVNQGLTPRLDQLAITDPLPALCTLPAATKEDLIASRKERLFPGGHTLGLRILYTPEEPVVPVVDIIFIHGLTGDPFRTWFHEQTSTYWPVDFLAKDITDARILAFGYDADVTRFIGAVGQCNINEHAENFLNKLAGLRADGESVSIS